MSRNVSDLCFESSDAVRKTADDIEKVLEQNKSRGSVVGGLSAADAKRTKNLVEIQAKSKQTLQELNQLVTGLIQSQDQKATPGLGLGSRGDGEYDRTEDKGNGKGK